MPEAKLAKEAGIYSAISMVTDFDCWHPDHDSVTVDQIINTLEKNSQTAFNFISEFCKQEVVICEEETKNLSSNSVITKTSKIKKNTKKKLKNIISNL